MSAKVMGKFMPVSGIHVIQQNVPPTLMQSVSVTIVGAAMQSFGWTTNKSCVWNQVLPYCFIMSHLCYIYFM